MTWKQYLAWQAWLDAQLNRPGRLEWYVMQLTAEVCKLPARMHGKNPRNLDAKLFRLNFTFTAADATDEPRDASGLTRKQAAEISKAGWLAMQTKPVVEQKHARPWWETRGGDRLHRAEDHKT